MFAMVFGIRKRPAPSRRRLPAFAIGLGLAFTALGSAPGFARVPQDTSASEYDIKAVFLYQFTRYLQWPEGTEPEVFTIAVLGDSKITEPLLEIAKKKTVGTKSIVVRPCSKIEEIGRPRILFYAKSAVPEIAQVLEKIRGTDVLVVGEAEGLASRGVAINFILQEGTVKFEMNEKALNEARIRSSSQLLRLAILVEGKGAGASR